jgi:hypothetical protein
LFERINWLRRKTGGMGKTSRDEPFGEIGYPQPSLFMRGRFRDQTAMGYV